jgi:DNA-binding FadR family transcriptional regulator
MNLPAGKPLPKVPRTSLVDEVIAAMRAMLSEDAWSPGTKLPSEQQLGRELGVGRSTVREALRVLEHLGLVESRSGLGTYVTERGGAARGRAPDAAGHRPHSRRVGEVRERRRARQRH